jgi:predicted membrane-bound spermidine synthase
MTTISVLTDAEPSKRGAHSFHLRLFFVFFMISGFCALLYEVVWSRLAMASFGVTTPLAAIVISMFMAGLGLGSWGAGILARRTLAADGRRALRFYSFAELMIGISSLAVPFELKFGRLLLLHMGGSWQSSRYYILVAVCVAITMVPWCTCMGATYPLLMSVIRQTIGQASEQSFSYLYVANVIGGLVGALVSAFALIEMLGFRGTLYIAGILNLILALSAFVLSSFLIHFPRVESRAIQTPVGAKPNGLSGSAMLLILFTSGFVSMGLEVVWVRQFTPYLGNLVYAFAGILAVYLLATAVGSQDYRSKTRSQSSGINPAVWTFLALFALLPVITGDPLLPFGFGVTGGLIRLSVIFLFCALTGFLTPMLVDSWSSGDPHRAGTAYAVNIAGSIIGPLMASFWLLPWLGERRSSLALSLPLFAIAAFIVFRKQTNSVSLGPGSKPRLIFVIAGILAICIAAASHDYESAFPKRIVKRDYAATVIAKGQGFDREILVNGVGMTNLTPVTKFMVHLPLALLSRQPQKGLVICFGMGTSFRSMLSWGIPTTAVDLIPSVPAMFGYYHADASKVANSPLAKIVIDDGRRFLDGSAQSYDVIIVDPPPPVEAAGSGLLYSREFYDVIKKHLRKDGILQIWYPAAIGDTATSVSVAKAVRESFPYVRAFGSFDHLGIYFLASTEPIPNLSSSELAERLPSKAASDFVEWGPRSSAKEQFDVILSQETTLDKLIAGDPQVPAMEDNQPINEYFLLRRWFNFYK